MDHHQIILASGSPFRKLLLQRLGLPFQTVPANIDESPLAGETPKQVVERLSREKALEVAEGLKGPLVIGSDQLAVLGSRVLGKPGTRERAREQLGAISGNMVQFWTGLCLVNSSTGEMQCDLVGVKVTFRSLSERQIGHYLDRESVLGCAASFRSEGLGIALCTSIESADPTALVGLPLIRLAAMLEREGVAVL